MPPEVVPPLYKVTLEDVRAQLGDDKHYDFYVIVSRKYEVNFDIDEDDMTPAQSSTRKKVKQSSDVEFFHEEDRFFEKYAKVHFDSETRKGLVNSYVILDHDGLTKSINELEAAIATW